MGQKHSAKYSLKPSSPSNKQQTAQIEDEVAFNTDSPGRAPDEPVGINLSSQENDYIRNAAQAMAKVWTENTVVESGAGINERGREEKEKESESNGNKTMLKEIEAELLEKKNEPKMTETENEPNMMEEDGTNVLDEPVANKIEAKEPKKNDDKEHEEKPEQSMSNDDDVAKNDAIQNVVEQKILQKESNLTHSAAADDVSHLKPSAKEPIIYQIQCEEKAAILQEQIVSNPVNSDEGAHKQKIVVVNEVQTKEQGVDEAKIDLEEENEQNEAKEIDKNKEENGINVEILGTEMSIQNNLQETMEKCVEEENVQKNEKKEVEGKNNLMAEIDKQQSPVLEGIANYVANQQTVHLDNETEERIGVEAESDEKENFLPIGNQNGEENVNEHQQTEMEGEVVAASMILLLENADPIPPAEKKAISLAECENELGELKQNEHQNECQQSASGDGEEEPTCTGKPSEL